MEKNLPISDHPGQDDIVKRWGDQLDSAVRFFKCHEKVHRSDLRRKFRRQVHVTGNPDKPPSECGPLQEAKEFGHSPPWQLRPEEQHSDRNCKRVSVWKDVQSTDFAPSLKQPVPPGPARTYLVVAMRLTGLKPPVHLIISVMQPHKS